MADDDKRSEHLLSDDAIPRVEVPKSESEGMRQFRLPSVLAKPVRPAGDTGERTAVREDKAAGKKRRRRRPSTGRFRDRTLNWFKTGEALEGEEVIEGDYEPYAGRNWRLIGGAIAGAIVVLALIAWALS